MKKCETNGESDGEERETNRSPDRELLDIAASSLRQGDYVSPTTTGTEDEEGLDISESTMELINRSKREMERRRQKREVQQKNIIAVVTASAMNGDTDSDDEESLDDAENDDSESGNSHRSFHDPESGLLHESTPFDEPPMSEAQMQHVKSDVLKMTAHASEALIFGDQNREIAGGASLDQLVMGIQTDKKTKGGSGTLPIDQAYRNSAPSLFASNRRDKFLSEESLDIRAVFQREESAVSSQHLEKQSDSWHDSVFSFFPQISTFGERHIDEPCCRGRRRWVVFLVVVVTGVVLVAALVDTNDMDTLSPSIAPSTLESSPSLSAAPSLSSEPSLFPSSTPSVAPVTITPKVSVTSSSFRIFDRERRRHHDGH